MHFRTRRGKLAAPNLIGIRTRRPGAGRQCMITRWRRKRHKRPTPGDMAITPGLLLRRRSHAERLRDHRHSQPLTQSARRTLHRKERCMVRPRTWWMRPNLCLRRAMGCAMVPRSHAMLTASHHLRIGLVRVPPVYQWASATTRTCSQWRLCHSRPCPSHCPQKRWTRRSAGPRRATVLLSRGRCRSFPPGSGACRSRSELMGRGLRHITSATAVVPLQAV
mmetsp:Transcript_46060/g.127986  ORF Transcript_46060/g.127986 Transcript_46060/m.127986 type:complete len:221 (-) Transcript_46060:228-890(-)